MAEKLERSKDDITCPICVELFREPVSLSCRHIFCRACLKCMVQKDNVITCPVCRSLTRLGIKGVEGLPVQLTLVNAVAKHRRQETVQNVVPNCSICEDEGNKPAASFCVTCSLFYCHGCVAVVHPMKGALRRHKLTTADKYVFDKLTTVATGSTDDVIKTSNQCADHERPLELFCESCRTLMCKKCVSDHDGHPVDDISTANRKNLTLLKGKTTALGQLKDKVQEMLAELIKFQADLEKRKSLHVDEIEKTSTEAIEAVNVWRKDSLESTENRYRAWVLTCAKAISGLKIQTEETESLIQSSRKYFSEFDIRAVGGQCQLGTKIDNLSGFVESNLQQQRVLNMKWQDDMNLDPVVPRKLRVGEIQISTPRLLFTESSGNGVDIRESRNVAVAVASVGFFVNSRSIPPPVALTDGRLQEGRHYWEFHITLNENISTPESNQGELYSAGVVSYSPGSLSKDWYVGESSHSWGVRVEYLHNQLMFACCHDAKPKFGRMHGAVRKYRVLPVHQEDVTERGTLRLGFYLNCEERTLAIIDCTYERELHTFTDLDMFEPLTPVVSVGRCREINVSIRIKQGDLSTLFKVLPNVFQF